MRIFLASLFALLLTAINAQERCGTNTAITTLATPQFQQHWQQLNQKVEAISAHHNHLRNEQTLVIPVVVHVVWNTPAQNISDEQIISQIDVLNEDYNRLNADTTNTRSIFKPIAASANVQFCLAQQDPLGNPTTGITRTYTTVSSFGVDDEMKFNSTGGTDAWPTDKYLNIWICNNWEVWGYSWFPGVEPEYDGVVVHYEAFGDTLNVVAPYNKGRTATHEIGHWLGLWHPFDNGCGGLTPTTCLGSGDRVCDTPSDNTEGSGCDTTTNDCIDTPIDLPDNAENFMDYLADSCINMFTLGQVERMWYFLTVYRQGLFHSNGCLPPTGTYADAIPISVTNPATVSCNTNYMPTVRVGNIGNTDLDSLWIHYSIDGGLTVSQYWQGNIAPGGFADIALPPSAMAVGTHSIHVFTETPNGSADPFPANDSLWRQFEIISSTLGIAAPFSEGFEAGNWLPAGWHTNNPDMNFDWDINSEYGGYNASDNSVIFENFWVNEVVREQKDELITPNIDLSSLAAPTLFFDLAYADPGSTYYSDTLEVWASDDCGSSWILLWRNGGVSLSSANTPVGSNNFYPNQASEWKTEYLAIPFIGSPAVQLKFVNITGWGYDLYLDNIMVDNGIGLTEINNNAAIKVWPNPANNQATITTAASGTNVLYVANVLGQVLLTTEIQSTTTINLEHFAKGLYWIRIGNETIKLMVE